MKIISNLNTLLCNHIEGALYVQNCHWNVEGPDFTQYHDLFSDIYSEYYSEVDKLAEYIRIVSGSSEYVKLLSKNVAETKTINPEIIIGSDINGMIVQISLVNDTLISGYNYLFNESLKINEQGLADYCSGRIDSLNKLSWKLKAITKE